MLLKPKTGLCLFFPEGKIDLITPYTQPELEQLLVTTEPGWVRLSLTDENGTSAVASFDRSFIKGYLIFPYTPFTTKPMMQ